MSDHLVGRACEDEAVERRLLAGREVERRVTTRHDREVQLDLRPGACAGGVAVLVHDGHRAEDDARRRPMPIHSRTTGTSSGFAEPPSFSSAAPASPAKAAVRLPQVPSRSGTSRRSGSYWKRLARRKREPLAGKPAAVAGEQPPDHRHRLAQRRQRPVLCQAERVEPRALDETEIRAPVRDGVQRSDLAGDLDRVQRVRVQRGRADPYALGRLRDQRAAEQIAGW